MLRNFLCLLLFPLSVLSQTVAPPDFHKYIKIPTAWIEKAREVDIDSTDQLVEELESYIRPDSIYLPSYLEHDHKGSYFKCKFVNLDDDPEPELVANIGWSISDPSFTVFKKIDNSWYLLYLEPYYIFYTDPELNIPANVSKNKVVYIRRMYERGTGIHSVAFNFFRLVNNKVYPCLEIADKTWIYGWSLFMNQKVKTNFYFSDKGNIHVHYRYSFFPGTISYEHPLCIGYEMLPLVSGDENVLYYWDKKCFIYRQKLHPENPLSLTPQKVACFGAFGNDSLFTKAYRYNIKHTLRNGTAKQKRILKDYLTAVREHRKPPSEEEEKAQIGDLNFYGPKE